MKSLKFLIFLIAFNFLRISAQTTDDWLSSPDFSETLQIFDTTLNCWKFATISDDELMCKMDKNIVGSDIIQINAIKSKIISSEKLKKAKIVTMSRDKVKIEKLPQKLGIHFKNLTKFIAINVGLKSIRRTDFINLSKLKVLNLGDNNLMNLPHDAFFELKDLEVIYLDRNQIRSLNVAIFAQSILLRVAFLNNNQLQRLDDIFVRNFYIEEIYLNNNFLRNINIDFRKYSHLKIVDLRKNSEICTTCEAIKPIKESSFNICNYEKALKTKFLNETFEDCAIKKIKTLNGSNFELNKCARKLNELKKLNNDLFKNETKFNDGYSMMHSISKFDSFIFTKLYNESVLHEKFETCLSEEIFKDLEIDNLMKNCTDTKRIESEKIEESYIKCSFCRPSKIEIEMKKCKIRFENSTAKAIDEFQKKVVEMFRN